MARSPGEGWAERRALWSPPVAARALDPGRVCRQAQFSLSASEPRQRGKRGTERPSNPEALHKVS